MKQDHIDKLIAHADAGRRIQGVLDDPVFKAFFDSRIADETEHMIEASISDDDRRRHAAMTIKILRDLRTHLQNAVTIGNRATAALDKAKEQANAT